MTDQPAGGDKRVELTIRGLILGCLICVVLTAANVYMGLKVALTFASSIPAAVVSMAVLRAFKNSTIWENNIVQTVASAAGTLSSVIFVLPGLLMVGWWSDFRFLDSFLICLAGGVLGVMYTIPLRRALVTNSDLPYPEGKAAAEVLKVGSGVSEGHGQAAAVEGGSAGLTTMIVSSAVAALLPVAIAMKFMAAGFSKFWKPTAATATGIGGGYSLALVGAGHLMGITVGVSMAVGIAIAWGFAVPMLVSLQHMAGDAQTIATKVWKTEVKLIGAGTIAAASVWTLAKLIVPVTRGVTSAIAASGKAAKGAVLPRTERDLPILIVGLIMLASFVPIAWMLYTFMHEPPSAPLLPRLVPLMIGGMIYIVVVGLAVSAVCGYMAGLIGSSNSPVSGLAILSVLGATLLLLAIAKDVAGTGGGAQALVAFSLFVTAILLTVATIANNNLQDLKTGQLVDATPWKQQVALLVGVLAGALIIPPVCNILLKANGFEGVAGHAISSHPLTAPQATLISSLASGVIQGTLGKPVAVAAGFEITGWGLIGIGAAVGLVLVVIDETLRGSSKGRLGLPPLGAALAIYLPTDVTTPVVLGALIGWAYDRWVAKKPYGEAAKQLGILLASGFIVGESLLNVIIAGLTYLRDNPDPLAFFGKDPVAGMGDNIGIAVFGGCILILYIWIERLAKTAAAKAGSA
ncbi:MAG TPA: oligopeptide transporter, OPT family [Caulobacteraceae bacterium]|jgi:putative OPT family oligopeptide transporter|nr:oligopeptide transporter, OPT family [Caulobacteraceae bacterium]